MPTIQLSERELRVALNVTLGVRREDIATSEGVSLGTIHADLRSIYRLLGIKKSAQVAAACQRAGIKLSAARGSDGEAK